MNPGLVWLLRGAPKRYLRGLRRKLRGVKGVLVVGASLVLVGFLVFAQVVQMLREHPDPQELAARARIFGPLWMLVITALSLVSPASRRGGLYFRPAEIGTLFPAPVSRRELLLYHVAGRAMIQTASALWLAVFVGRHAPTWYGCILGLVLALFFLQLVLQGSALLTAAIGRRLARPARVLALLLVAAAVVAGGIDVGRRLPPDAGVLAQAEALSQHVAVRIVSAPFVPFARTFAGTGPLDVLAWAAVSALLVGGALALLVRLDAAYEESALDMSADVRRKLERIRAGGSALAMMGPRRTGFSVPALPHWGGAGPIAWRQCVEIVRHARAVLTSLALLLVWPAIVLGVMHVTAPEDGEGVAAAGYVALPLVLVLSILSTQNIGFDFRRDYDRIAFLRSLPVTPFAIAAGQVAPVAVLLAAMQWLIASLVLLVVGTLPAPYLPLLFVPLLPVAWAVTAVDNLLCLLLPARFEPDDAANVGFMGKLMLLMFLKFAVLGVLAVVAALAGVVVYFVAGRHLAPAVLAALLVVTCADVLLTWLVALAFVAYDPARETPD